MVTRVGEGPAILVQILGICGWWPKSSQRPGPELRFALRRLTEQTDEDTNQTWIHMTAQVTVRGSQTT